MYYLILAFQAFCIYHLIKNRNDFYWIFLIIFLPVIGCVIYLVTQVYNKRDVNKIQEDITSVLVPSKKVKDLEKQLQFSDTYQNRVNLADAYSEMKEYNKAITEYKIAIEDKDQNNYYIIKKMVVCYYNIEDYQSAIDYAEEINSHAEFPKSRTQFIYGLALEKVGQIEKAEAELRQIDQRYSNYDERLVLAKFLMERNKREEAEEILKEIHTESQHMTSPNKRKYRNTLLEVEKLLKTV